MRKLAALFALALAFAAPAFALDMPDGPVVQAELVSHTEAVAPGVPFTVTLKLKMPPHWHTYTDPPGDAGLPTEIKWELPPGYSASGIRWPKATVFKEGQFTTYGYADEVSLPVEITPPAGISGDQVLKAEASWLVCHEICIPETRSLTITLPVGTAAAQPPSDTMMPWLSTLLFAFLGGLVLNLMPCVFPVLSLKCLAVARAKGLTRRQALHESLAYTAGILLTFAIIAVALIAFKNSGEAIGWGFQMQSPSFVTVMALLLFAIGLNLSGMFDLPVLLGGVGADLAREPTVKGSFAAGVLATLVAAPCTAPFMAAAVGYALTLPTLPALAIFEALGLGLAFPFLAIGLFPAVAHALPKPGAWMETFRQLLAFPMYLSAVWLVWVLAMQAGAQGVAVALTAMTLFAFVVWVSKKFKLRWLALVLGLVLVAGTVASVQRFSEKMTEREAYGEKFDPARLAALRASGTPVFVDATAAWCITCQVNKQTSITNSRVQAAFAKRGIVLMVADWTKRDAAITVFLASFGHQGVPLYVYFPPGGESVVLPQLLTPDIVLSAIGEKG